MALFPLLDFMGLAMGTATIQLLGQQCVQSAANSSSMTKALTAMQTTANNMMNTGFARFAKITPTAGFGYMNCGCNLYVVATDFNSKKSQTYGPLPANPVPSVDQTKYVYEYQTKVSYILYPFVNLGGIPFIGNVPGCGQPTTIQWTSQSSVEFPDGLTSYVNRRGRLDTVASFL
jgi:hypothetical protein